MNAGNINGPNLGPLLLSDIDLFVPKTVYPPREDTLLLMDSIPTPVRGMERALEIGSGSGFLSIKLASLGWKVTSIDVNPYAVAATRFNCRRHGHHSVECLEGSFDEIDSLQRMTFDLIIWNLPYLSAPGSGPHLEPIEEASMIDIGEGGWSSELRKFLDSKLSFLSPGGCVLLLYRTHPVSPSKPEEWLQEGWSTREVSRATFGNETLSVYSHWRPWSGSEPLRIDTIGSTMDYDFSVMNGPQRVIAKHQTKGRGRNGREWKSDPMGLAATWRVDITGNINPSMVQVSLGALISRSLGLELKWPNDIVDSQFRKCGGIISTLEDNSSVKIGVGINKSTQSVQGVETSGWETVSECLDSEKVFMIVDASIASILESHAIIGQPEANNTSKIAWSSLSRTFSKGVDLRFQGYQANVIGLTDNGEILINQEQEIFPVGDLERIQWH